jgi:hypothetical protein
MTDLDQLWRETCHFNRRAVVRTFVDWRNSAPSKALDFSGCNSRPGTGSLHPVAIDAEAEATKRSKLSMERVARRLGERAGQFPFDFLRKFFVTIEVLPVLPRQLCQLQPLSPAHLLQFCSGIGQHNRVLTARKFDRQVL